MKGKEEKLDLCSLETRINFIMNLLTKYKDQLREDSQSNGDSSKELAPIIQRDELRQRKNSNDMDPDEEAIKTAIASEYYMVPQNAVKRRAVSNDKF